MIMIFLFRDFSLRNFWKSIENTWNFSYIPENYFCYLEIFKKNIIFGNNLVSSFTSVICSSKRLDRFNYIFRDEREQSDTCQSISEANFEE